MQSESALYFGTVMHRRLGERAHRFVYRVVSVLLDLESLAATDRTHRLFGVNRWSIFAFYERDHGPRDGSALRPWIDARLAEAGCALDGGRVLVHCFPRILGYAFNPLTVWFCFHADGSLRAVLYEVSNTFGQHHCYLFPIAAADRTADVAASPILRHACDKGFYVSPFIPMDARYHFRVRPPTSELLIAIHETVAEKSLLVATHTATRAQLSDRMLISALVRHPLMMVKVIIGIHWEAFRLVLKGARFYRKPRAPDDLVTVVRSPSVVAETANPPTI